MTLEAENLLSTDDSSKDTTAPTLNTCSSIRSNGDHLAYCYVEEYDQLLNQKVSSLASLLQVVNVGNIQVEVFESMKINFRMRANFIIWRDNPRPVQDCVDNLFYAMYDSEKMKSQLKVKHSKTHPCELTRGFPRGTVLMNRLMADLMNALRLFPELLPSLFEVRFVTTQVGQAIIVMCYHKPLSANWKELASKLSVLLNDAKIVGRSRKLKVVVGGDDIIEEVYTVRLREGIEKKIKNFQTEGAFSQPNAYVCENMLNWTLDITKNCLNYDLLELYCGGGTFTAALSFHFRKVLATEMSKVSVELANLCIKANDLKNIQILRLSSEEFTEAFVSKKPFKRLQAANISFDEYDIKYVLVDPPRAGLDLATCQLLQIFQFIIYISCNPETLERDLQILTKTHAIVRLAAFDQFPYTHHLECGVFLKKVHDVVIDSQLHIVNRNLDESQEKRQKLD